MIATLPHPSTGEPIELEYSYYPGYIGSRDEWGNAAEPDEPEEIAIISAFDKDGSPVDLEGYEVDLEKQILNQ